MELKERILGLDIGDKRIGVAVSDPFGLFTTGLGVVIRNNDNRAIEEIKNYCKTYNVKKIVAGIPYNMDGTIGVQAKKTMEFMSNFMQEYEVIYKDERLTSFEAEEILKIEKKKYTKNKGLVDIQSACIILQSYLGEQNG
ncbi:MAG: Holliday junction resolvase RuvX [Candidatus Gastranaerophilales bacterium]|nr:Holliday junction resolvase RuvX [Candidatus Gastranaerophilales bacterium]